VRARDGATNASPVLSLTLTVIQAVNDTRAAFNANTSRYPDQRLQHSSETSVLANDQPIGLPAARSSWLGTGQDRWERHRDHRGDLSFCGFDGATPAIGGNTVCTNGCTP